MTSRLKSFGPGAFLTVSRLLCRNCLQVHGATSEAAFASLEDIPAQPCGCYCGATRLRWKVFSVTFTAVFHTTTIKFINGDASDDGINGLDAVSLVPVP